MRALERWTLKVMTVEVEKVESPVVADAKADMHNSTNNGSDNEEGASSSDVKAAPSAPSYLWENLPVGPVLAARLFSTVHSKPTPVQRASFAVLTAGENQKKIKTGGTAGNAVRGSRGGGRGGAGRGTGRR